MALMGDKTNLLNNDPLPFSETNDVKIHNVILRLASKRQTQNIKNSGSIEITFVDDNCPL